MNYRSLGKCEVKVSEIGFGAWAIGGRSEATGVQWAGCWVSGTDL